MVDYAPVVTSKTRLNDLREKLSAVFTTIASTVQSTVGRITADRKTVLNKKKIGTYLFIAIVAVAVIAGIRMALSRTVTSAVSQTGAVAADAITVPIEREFSFNVFDKDKQLSDPVKYILTSAQLTKQIIIKGQKATAVKGRTFFILNLKLVNEFDQSLFLNTRNYIRVQPAGTEDKLAPEIHNDTVEAQPLSTKLTRIGLPVDETVKEFTLFVGELEGEKEQISVKFP